MKEVLGCFDGGCGGRGRFVIGFREFLRFLEEGLKEILGMFEKCLGEV